MESWQGWNYFVFASSFLFVNRKIDEVFNELLLGHKPLPPLPEEEDGEEEEEEEEGGEESSPDDSGSKLRRIGSEFSLGLNRVRSVDDMIKNFDWQICTTGQTALHGIRYTGYALFGAYMFSRLLSAHKSG